MQSIGMDSGWAQDNLQTIRLLMERSAVYRRALAPIMIFTGSLGLVAAVFGWLFRLESPRSFGLFWLGVSVVATGGAYLLARRQALRDEEPFWSPPTRRVTQALVPLFLLGLVLGLVVALPAWRDPLHVWWLPPSWMALYGCALHAAGFFMPRGMKLLGWLFVLWACVVFVVVNQRSHAAGFPPLYWAHVLMGLFFGGLHLAYGIYLRFTERGKNAT